MTPEMKEAMEKEYTKFAKEKEFLKVFRNINERKGNKERTQYYTDEIMKTTERLNGMVYLVIAIGFVFVEDTENKGSYKLVDISNHQSKPGRAV